MGKTILVVDDNPEVSSVVSEFLGKKGFRVITALSGKDGVKNAQRFKPDIILLDITMPKMDGFQVLEKLKDYPDTMRIPVIMLTAKSDDESKLKAASLYSQSYVVQ